MLNLETNQGIEYPGNQDTIKLPVLQLHGYRKEKKHSSRAEKILFKET